MSCATINSQPVRLIVTVGNLPEGYCPATFQQFANDFAARLIVTPNQNNSTFVTGSIEPTSNIGPWLKDCVEWFVFDDSTGRYRPIPKGGFDNMQYFTASSSFVVPDNIFKLKISAFGAGGGGFFDGGALSSGAGGGGAYGLAIRSVIPAQVITLTVGTGGSAGNPGTTGGSTTVLGMTAGGGAGGTATSNGSGAGGVATGFDVNLSGQFGQSNVTGANAESDANGGDAGGWGGKGGVTAFNNAATGRNGTAPGGGGSGAANAAVATAGDGANGAILIEW